MKKGDKIISVKTAKEYFGPTRSQKETLRFIKNFNPAIFRGRKGLRELKDILLDYQTNLRKRS